MRPPPHPHQYLFIKSKSAFALRLVLSQIAPSDQNLKVFETKMGGDLGIFLWIAVLGG
jgi:hypothetical protein